MIPSLRVARASFIKELRVWKRNPQKLVLVILLPLMFFLGFSMLMGGVYFGSGVETAVVLNEQNPGVYTDGLIEILGEYDPIPPRLDPIMMDSETAGRLFQNGEILLVITIPDGFEDALENNESVSIHVQVANIHEDLTKNLRMPVIRKLDIFYQTYLLTDSLVDFEVENLRPFTPFLFLLSYLIFGVWPNGDLLTFLSLTFLLALFSSGIGIIAGAIFRNSVFVVPVAALGAIFYWIVGGGIAPLELVGASFDISNEYLPVSNVYRSLIRMFVEGSYVTLSVDLTVIGIFAAILLAISPMITAKVAQLNMSQVLEDIKHRRRNRES
jgi:hypothetical protein